MAHLLLQATSPRSGQRLEALDELKGIAIILVVLYHAGGVLTWNNHLRGDLGVDMFVILSGLGLSLSPSYPGTKAFLKRRLLRIFPVYWLVLTAYLLLNTHFLQLDYTPANIVLHYLGIHGWFGDQYAMTINDSFWFITLIVSLYLIHAFIQRFAGASDRMLLVGAVVSVAAAFAWYFTGQSGSFGHLGLRLPGFFLGLLVGRLLLIGRLELTFSTSLLLAILLFSYVPYTQGVVFHTVAVAAGLMLVYTFGLHPQLVSETGSRLRRGLRFLGDHSLEIFLLHQPLIREYNVYLHGRWLNDINPSRFSLTVGMLIAITVTLILSVELRRLQQRFL